MGGTDEVLRGVDIQPEYQPLVNRACVDGSLGFVAADHRYTTESNRQLLTVLGFAVSGWQQGSDEVLEYIHPITSFDGLPDNPGIRTLNRQGKGVGPRFYNTYQAMRGTAEDPTEIGLYAFDLCLNAVLDLRRRNDHTKIGTLRHAARWGMLQAQKHARGTRYAVQRVHADQEPVNAVLMNQTPDALRKKKERDAEPSPIPEHFLIIRNHTIVARLVGKYDRTGTTSTDSVQSPVSTDQPSAVHA